MEIRFEDIVFWIAILSLIGLALWLFHGSPSEINAIMAIIVFTAVSEIAIWKFMFKKDKSVAAMLGKFDKKTAIALEKVKSRFDIIDYKLDNIEKHIRK